MAQTARRTTRPAASTASKRTTKGRATRGRAAKARTKGRATKGRAAKERTTKGRAAKERTTPAAKTPAAKTPAAKTPAGKTPAKTPRSATRTASSGSRKGTKPVLLSGGNPQIAKADGDAPVRAYIAALSGWQRELARRVDALIVRSVPGVQKAVKWNSPMYGIADQGFFLGIHVFTRYLKLAFFRGSLLRPPPPGPSKHPETRYLDLHEGVELDEAQLASWCQQAAALPGWRPGRA